MRGFAIKGFFRAMVALSAVVASVDGFAQSALPRRNLLNRPQLRTPTRPAVPTPPTQPAAQASNQPTMQSASQAGQKIDHASKSGEAPALNWEAAPSDIVLQAYAERLSKTVLKDPATPSAQITLKSREGQKLTEEEYLEAIRVILEMNGIHIEPYGESFIRALPRKDVRKEGIPLITDAAQLKESGKVVSLMIPFKNIATDEAQKALEGFKSNNGILLVFERTNSILATDTEQNIQRMLEIAKMIDVETPVLENVFVRQIKNASASDIKTALEAIVQESQKEQEKNGKKVNNNATPAPSYAAGLLRRPGQQQQPAQPVNNASLVMTVSDADRGMIRGKVLILADERSNKLVIVTQKPNMDFFDKVIEQLDVETTPDTVVKVYRLKYAEAEEVSDMINDLIGNAPSGKSSGKANQNAAAKTSAGGGANLTRSNTAVNAPRKSANQRTGEAKAGELNKENTTVLADKRINGLVVMTNKELVPVVEQIIESMDVKLSQVLIETCIIEVTLGENLKTGIDWVKLGSQAVDEEGKPIPGAHTLGTDGELGQYALGGGGGGNAAALFGFVATNAVSYFANPTGAGINYFLKSDKLNLGAIISASKSDNRAKYIASPVIMTVDNKEATIEATESRKFYSGSTSNGSYGNTSVSYNYSDKDLGIKIKVTPKINPNGTVMLEVEEEYSQLGAGQSVLVSSNTGTGAPSREDVDTALQRKMSADILLENAETVVLGGLTETSTYNKETGIPILKDLPWIGKWLFGKVEQSENRSELLIFMTPYVLNDGEAAQAEALRRKKALSDARPWEDHGWSASSLADPVSKKEQMRRLKDEWKRQDEERKTKLAIESEKIQRVKALESMSKEEREFWLEQHKDELKEEQQEELEKMMLDDESQVQLKRLADEVRARKLKEAEKVIEKADAVQREQNERARLDAEKAKNDAEAAKKDGQ